VGRRTLGGSAHELSKDSGFCCDNADFIYFHLMTVLQCFTLLSYLSKNVLPFFLGFVKQKRKGKKEYIQMYV
jgi:hypothetical protein